MNPLKKNDEGSDDPEYDPKVHHYWKQLQKLFLLLWKTIVWTLCPLSKYHELPFKSTLQISTSTLQSENRMYIHCSVPTDRRSFRTGPKKILEDRSVQDLKIAKRTSKDLFFDPGTIIRFFKMDSLEFWWPIYLIPLIPDYLMLF